MIFLGSHAKDMPPTRPLCLWKPSVTVPKRIEKRDSLSAKPRFAGGGQGEAGHFLTDPLRSLG
jgi:hypothetical protein